MLEANREMDTLVLELQDALEVTSVLLSDDPTVRPELIPWNLLDFRTSSGCHLYCTGP